jgi:hypothetical protein
VALAATIHGTQDLGPEDQAYPSLITNEPTPQPDPHVGFHSRLNHLRLDRVQEPLRQFLHTTSVTTETDYTSAERTSRSIRCPTTSAPRPRLSGTKAAKASPGYPTVLSSHPAKKELSMLVQALTSVAKP